MKTTLNQAFIINKLSIDVKPELSSSGKVVFEANPDQKPYIVFDDHRDSPVGFGVKVSLTKKTYVIQRRVSSGDRSVSEGKKPSSVLKVKVGNVSDFPSIDQAREAARQLVQTMITTKRNPNKIKRETDASELTISEVFAQYRQILT
ncbi:integrase, partial [Salmonella enterica]|nr:integrase [Salmonella enterica]EHW9404003.1 integrase [Salmonella enterica]